MFAIGDEFGLFEVKENVHYKHRAKLVTFGKAIPALDTTSSKVSDPGPQHSQRMRRV
jgi:hypothetical protein